MVSKTPTLDLDYNPNVPEAVLAQLEAAARGVGLPLMQVELLGQDATTAKLFISHVQDGSVWSFLDHVEWAALESIRQSHGFAAIVSSS